MFKYSTAAGLPQADPRRRGRGGERNLPAARRRGRQEQKLDEAGLIAALRPSVSRFDADDPALHRAVDRLGAAVVVVVGPSGSSGQRSTASIDSPRRRPARVGGGGAVGTTTEARRSVERARRRSAPPARRRSVTHVRHRLAHRARRRLVANAAPTRAPLGARRGQRQPRAQGSMRRGRSQNARMTLPTCG